MLRHLEKQKHVSLRQTSLRHLLMLLMGSFEAVLVVALLFWRVLKSSPLKEYMRHNKSYNLYSFKMNMKKTI